MTEWRAIDAIKKMKMETADRYVDRHKAFDLAIKALEEIQQYRSIGTVKYFKECADILNKVEANELAKIIDEWLLYRKIGTVEECREARERQRAKKPLQGEPYTWIDSVRVKGRYRDVRKTSYSHACPNCGKDVAMDMSCCKYCGQAISWESDTD